MGAKWTSVRNAEPPWSRAESAAVGGVFAATAAEEFVYNKLSEYHRKQRQEKQHEQGRGKQVCPNCGVEFELDWNCKIRRFCSDECRKEWWKEYRKANPSGEPGMRGSSPA